MYAYADNDKTPESTHNMGAGRGKARLLCCTCLLYQLGSQGSLFGKFFYGHMSFILAITARVQLSFVVLLKTKLKWLCLQ